MNVETGHIVAARDLDALRQEERDRYRLVPERLAPAAAAHRARGESVYEAAPRSPLARFGKQALREKTRKNKAARRARHRG